MPRGDPLAGEAFLVISELDAGRGDGRVRTAAALTGEDLEGVAGDQIERAASLFWDSERDDLRARVTDRLGALVLQSDDRPAPPGPATTAALVERVRTDGLAILPWTPAARSLQARVAFLRATLGDDGWTDLSDAALLATLDEWLVPLLAAATGRADLDALDLDRILRRLLGHERLAALDDLAPAALRLPSGRSVPLDYEGGQPKAAVRVQDVFGTTTHPTVAAGRVPVVLELLSPANRPVQVTADLPGFWAGTYAAVRKEMLGRYPKHPWPADPAVARPSGRVERA